MTWPRSYDQEVELRFPVRIARCPSMLFLCYVSVNCGVIYRLILFHLLLITSSDRIGTEIENT